MNQNHIKLHRLSNGHTGVEVERWIGNSVSNAEAFQPHRHDHYTCLLLDKGKIDILLDFKPVSIKPKMLFVSHPGQVHQVVSSTSGSGWYISFQSHLIDEPIRTALDESLTEMIAVLLTSSEEAWFKKNIGLIAQLDELNKGADLNRVVIHALLKAFVYEAMITYRRQESYLAAYKSPRQLTITKDFKGLLKIHFKTLKKPSEYADLLNISVNYLNACVKAVSGISVSSLIHREIIAESQRLLYYTTMDIKEIASEMGIDDTKYFSRLFSNIVGMPPGAFRQAQTR